MTELATEADCRARLEAGKLLWFVRIERASETVVEFELASVIGDKIAGHRVQWTQRDSLMKKFELCMKMDCEHYLAGERWFECRRENHQQFLRAAIWQVNWSIAALVAEFQRLYRFELFEPAEAFQNRVAAALENERPLSAMLASGVVRWRGGMR